ncbi:MAG: FAD-dependent oxidoreductase, partial [Candidatus Thorarchaeota archaeon]|nr:FAD-dependent oxidoreductase [Candidatus Thorarchaeota archaeon]
MGLKRKQVDKLSKVFGDRLITEKHELLIQSTDVGALPKQVGWLMNNKPDALVQPVTPEEIQELYKIANDEKIPLVPRGAGTSGYGGSIPRKGGIIVDIRQMDNVLEVNKEEKYVLVEPGLSWSNLQHHLNRQEMDLRCYPSSGLAATISGWVAQGG